MNPIAALSNPFSLMFSNSDAGASSPNSENLHDLPKPLHTHVLPMCAFAIFPSIEHENVDRPHLRRFPLDDEVELAFPKAGCMPAFQIVVAVIGAGWNPPFAECEWTDLAVLDVEFVAFRNNGALPKPSLL